MTLTWSRGIRQFHRWVAIVFTVTVVVAMVAAARQEPAEWVFYLPLPPLFLLLGSGLYLFALPYVSRRRGRERTAESH